MGEAWYQTGAHIELGVCEHSGILARLYVLVHWSGKSVPSSFRAQNARGLEAENHRGQRSQVSSNPRAHGLPEPTWEGGAASQWLLIPFLNITTSTLEEPTGKETQFGRKSHFFAQIQLDIPLKSLRVLENSLCVSWTFGHLGSPLTPPRVHDHFWEKP